MPVRDPGCPFCRIAAGDPDGQILATGDAGFVIAPLEPVTDGHLLVIPWDHVEDALEDPRVTGDVFALAAVTAHGNVNLITSVGAHATQTVRHLHAHVVPRRAGDGLKLPWRPDDRPLE